MGDRSVYQDGLNVGVPPSVSYSGAVGQLQCPAVQAFSGSCGPKAHGRLPPRWTPPSSTRPVCTTPAPATRAVTVSVSAPLWPPMLKNAPRQRPACSGGGQIYAVSIHGRHRLPSPFR